MQVGLTNILKPLILFFVPVLLLRITRDQYHGALIHKF